jgi:hypothetical protein
MAKRTGKQKPTLGSIVAIPLPDGRFAFAKIFKDQDLAVYDLVADKIESPDTVTKHKIAFFQGVTDAAIKSGDWPIIGEEPFPNEDAAWAPPRAAGILPGFDIDPVTLLISYKGSSRPATPEEVAGLDIELFYTQPEDFIEVVVDRLIRGDHKKYRVPE